MIMGKKLLTIALLVGFLSGCAAIPAFMLPIAEGAKAVVTVLQGSPTDDVGDHQEGPM